MTNKITYTQQGDYLLPDLKLPEQPKVAHLAEIDKLAEDMFFRLVKQIAEREGVTEQLKAKDQMQWVRKMNNIRNRAEEIVNNEMIYQ